MQDPEQICALARANHVADTSCRLVAELNDRANALPYGGLVLVRLRFRPVLGGKECR